MTDTKDEPPWLKRQRESMLTPEELAELRRKAKESAAYFEKAFADLRPKKADDPA